MTIAAIMDGYEAMLARWMDEWMTRAVGNGVKVGTIRFKAAEYIARG